MITITERDKKFLLVLNETGACNAKLPLTIYPKRYCRTKLEKMEKEKIIIRKYDLIALGIKGKAYLESIGVVPIIVFTKPIASQRRLARATELKYLLPTMKVFTSAQYKKEKNLNREMQFVAAATTTDQIDYLIYDAPILLVGQTSKNASVLDYIKEHLATDGNIYILGENGAVSDSVLNSIKLLGFSNFIRLDGKDRIETNLKIEASLDVVIVPQL